MVNATRVCARGIISLQCKPFAVTICLMNPDHNRMKGTQKREAGLDRSFYVLAPSVNAVRRALHRAPGGARVVGRHDRATILCTHTMDGHSLARHWPVIVSRLAKMGLAIVPRPGSETGKTASRQNLAGD
jgi:hypothetical protein